MKYHTQIDRNHPALAGHFPGHPVVPGVVLLDHVIAAFRKERGFSCNIQKIPSVKFLSPLPPGARVEFTFEISDNLARFTGKCAEKTIVSGQLQFSKAS